MGFLVCRRRKKERPRRGRAGVAFRGAGVMGIRPNVRDRLGRSRFNSYERLGVRPPVDLVLEQRENLLR